MDKVRGWFEKHARLGITLSAEQLAKFARQKGIKVKMKELRQIRHEFKFTAMASRYRRPLKYMSSSVGRYGLLSAYGRTSRFHKPTSFAGTDWYLRTCVGS